MSFRAQWLSSTLAAMHFSLVAFDYVNAEVRGIEAPHLAAGLIGGEYA